MIGESVISMTEEYCDATKVVTEPIKYCALAAVGIGLNRICIVT